MRKSCLQAIVKQQWPKGFVVRVVIMIKVRYYRHAMSLNVRVVIIKLKYGRHFIFQDQAAFGKMVLVYILDYP